MTKNKICSTEKVATLLILEVLEEWRLFVGLILPNINLNGVHFFD